eukprot:15482183-Alexandrium_andersonii.AAC.1
MFRREYALLLWVIEGDLYLRAHDGVAYLYHQDGAFVVCRGYTVDLRAPRAFRACRGSACAASALVGRANLAWGGGATIRSRSCFA